jgi:hypothetical protein
MIPLIHMSRWRHGSAPERAVIAPLRATIGHTDHPSVTAGDYRLERAAAATVV